MQLRRKGRPPRVNRDRRCGPPLPSNGVLVNRVASCPRGINDYRMDLTPFAHCGHDRNVRWEGHEIDMQSELERFVGSHVLSRLSLSDHSFQPQLNWRAAQHF